MRIIILFCISCAVFATLGETEKINEDQSIAVEPAYNLDRVQRDSESRQLKQEKEKEKRPEKNQDPVKKKKELKEKKKQKKEKKENKPKKGRKNKSGKSKKKGVNRRNNLNKQSNSGKNRKNPKNDKDVSDKIKKEKTIKKKLGKNAGISKQDTCYADLLAKTKKFVVYQSQSQKLNRITSWVKLAQNKKAKALSTFSPARNALGTATNQGTSCAGNPSALGAANTTYTTLVSCNTTASTLCNVSLSATSATLVTKCTDITATYIADFKACLKTGACSCFQGLVIADLECEDFSISALEAKIKAEKNDCINPDKKGSFGNCRQEERLAAPFAVDCCGSYGVVTTQAPGRRHMRLNLNKFFHN